MWSKGCLPPFSPRPFPSSKFPRDGLPSGGAHASLFRMGGCVPGCAFWDSFHRSNIPLGNALGSSATLLAHRTLKWRAGRQSIAHLRRRARLLQSLSAFPQASEREYIIDPDDIRNPLAQSSWLRPTALGALLASRLCPLYSWMILVWLRLPVAACRVLVLDITLQPVYQQTQTSM
ncbi:hypothetical protein CALVIDRAFT_18252 [Calocera viscosa TUFC12733]|uniref:Uncharacterized protein n=1 Tax=Calocera viscosa (strain TUFC12733) TaxID=1330018 RepID=A0A167SDG9_CALVF|nr:hypothetical protein CALVIDRAFT_18252 [Calocera viscosa TUFC12733]